MTNLSLYEDVERASESIKNALGTRKPEIGMILGSGLGPFADELEDALIIPYQDIPGFAQSTVKGHAGKLVVGKSQGVEVMVLQGRVHCYEGLPISQVVLPTRTLIAAGAKTLIITNAAGGIREDMTPGDLVIMSDHLNLQWRNPLVGENDERFGVRFPDMSNAYDKELRQLAKAAGKDIGLDLSEGVYAGLLGPSYETPAEIRMLKAMGADLAGMSTVPEVIVANHMGAKVLGISCVTNKAAGLGGALSHEEVKETAERVMKDFIALLNAVIVRMVKNIP